MSVFGHVNFKRPLGFTVTLWVDMIHVPQLRHKGVTFKCSWISVGFGHCVVDLGRFRGAMLGQGPGRRGPAARRRSGRPRAGSDGGWE